MESFSKYLKNLSYLKLLIRLKNYLQYFSRQTLNFLNFVQWLFTRLEVKFGSRISKITMKVLATFILLISLSYLADCQQFSYCTHPDDLWTVWPDWDNASNFVTCYWNDVGRYRFNPCPRTLLFAFHLQVGNLMIFYHLNNLNIYISIVLSKSIGDLHHHPMKSLRFHLRELLH